MNTNDFKDHQELGDGTRRQFITRGVAALGGAVLLGPAIAEMAAAAPRSAPKRVPIGGLASTTLGNWSVFEGVADPKRANQMKDISASVRGVVHELDTAQGGAGVTVLAGHRSSWNRPFRYIERLQVGETVRYDNYSGDGTQTEYRVVEIKFPLDPVEAYDEVCANAVAYGSDTRLNLYACCRRNGRPTSSLYRIAAFCVAV